MDLWAVCKFFFFYLFEGVLEHSCFVDAVLDHHGFRTVESHFQLQYYWSGEWMHFSPTGLPESTNDIKKKKKTIRLLFSVVFAVVRRWNPVNSKQIADTIETVRRTVYRKPHRRKTSVIFLSLPSHPLRTVCKCAFYVMNLLLYLGFVTVYSVFCMGSRRRFEKKI